MLIDQKIYRNFLLSIPITRELIFFIFQKRIYKKPIDRKIFKLFNEKKKLSTTKINNLIISLTSFPQRIDEVKYTIYSLLDQSILPEKIILWLAEAQFPNKEHDLPKELVDFKKYGFFIMWCEDIKSYKKLIPALEYFPDYYIVTADDDIYYKRKWLEKLWFEHLKYPENIVCHIGKEITYNNKIILPYNKWKKYARKRIEGFNVLGCSGGGALYHWKYLCRDTNKKELFLKFAPYADDIWFYFMAILNGNKISVVSNPYFKVKYIDPYREYGLKKEENYTLASINVDNGFNDKQFMNIINYYNIDLYSYFKDKRTISILE